MESPEEGHPSIIKHMVSRQPEHNWCRKSLLPVQSVHHQMVKPGRRYLSYYYYYTRMYMLLLPSSTTVTDIINSLYISLKPNTYTQLCLSLLFNFEARKICILVVVSSSSGNSSSVQLTDVIRPEAVMSSARTIYVPISSMPHVRLLRVWPSSGDLVLCMPDVTDFNA